ncbi:MAG: GNAT family N-acetyltransferase [Rubrivivax sp.]|nr:GNAT family N-acetyltransferase [Rubrivivax sp.]
MSAGRCGPTRWTWARFADLRRDDLYDALALRSRVFVVEQRCAYLDLDGHDRAAWHLLGRDGSTGALLSTLRVLDEGTKYAEPSIGRVVTAPEARGAGHGRALFAEGLARCLAAWPGRRIRLDAQAYLESFYAGFGFAREGAPYSEDGIAHVLMWRLP